MEFYKIASAAIILILSSNVNAALVSTLTSFDNTGGLIAGDQSNTTINDWATASAFHVGDKNIVVENMMAVFGSTSTATSKYLEIGVYESTGTHGVDLAPGKLIGLFDTSKVHSSDDKFSIYLNAYNSFVLSSNTGYLLVWNAKPGAPYLGTKRTGTQDQMINNGVAGVFTGEILSSQDGGSSWYSLNQYGFDYASLNGKVLAGGTVSAVPVTVAAWLFSSGLFFLVGMAWRKRV